MNSENGFRRMADSMSQGLLYPGRAIAIVLGMTLVAMLLRIS
jgi:hypothetical protein